MGSTKSTCGAVTLLAAVFGKDADLLKRHLGLPSLSESRERREEERRRIKADQYVTLVCFQCGNTFERLASLVTHQIEELGYQHTFCNNRCQGKWSGTHYGFAAHPENVLHKTRIHDWDAIWAWHRLTGYGAWKLGDAFGISRGTTGVILWKMRKSIGKAI